jgi:hypothetical protein
VYLGLNKPLVFKVHNILVHGSLHSTCLLFLFWLCFLFHFTQFLPILSYLITSFTVLIAGCDLFSGQCYKRFINCLTFLTLFKVASIPPLIVICSAESIESINYLKYPWLIIYAPKRGNVHSRVWWISALTKFSAWLFCVLQTRYPKNFEMYKNNGVFWLTMQTI